MDKTNLSRDELKRWRADQMKIFENNRRVYLEMSEEDMSVHHGEYVGIVDGRIVGFEKDLQSIEVRIREEYGNVHRYVKKVGSPDREARVGSLRFVT